MKLSIAKKITFSMVIFSTVISIVFIVFFYFSQKAAYMEDVDFRLKLGADAINAAVGADFVDKYTKETPPAPEFFEKSVRKLSKLAFDNSLTYIYMMTKNDDKVLTAISSATPEELAKNEWDPFLKEYDGTEGINNGFKENNSFFEEAADEYGTFRSYLATHKSDGGKIYMVGCDM